MSPEETLAFRQHLGLSQRALAEVLGLATMTISCWERGVRTPSTPQVLRLAFQRLVQLRQNQRLGFTQDDVNLLEVAAINAEDNGELTDAQDFESLAARIASALR